MGDDSVKPSILEAANEEVIARVESLIKHCSETDCDVLGVRELLHKYNYKYYEAFKDDILTRMRVSYKVDVQSLN